MTGETSVTINRHLNLVIPVERADGSLVYVHSMPIRRETFEAYGLIIAKTFAAIYQQGLNFVAGPGIAAILLRETAQAMGRWDGPEGVESGLVNEVKRLTNVVVPTAEGWRTVPYADAVRTGALDGDDAAEVEGQVTFFIVASAMHKRSQLAGVLDRFCSLMEVSTSSLNCTEFARSLGTSTETARTGETESPETPEAGPQRRSSLPG